MSQVRFIGCLHLGHTKMAQRRGFESSEAHDEHLIKTWNKVVHKRDLTYILGDVTMERSNFYPLLDRMAGRKIVVLGNHDLKEDVRELLNHVETVAGMIDYKHYCLTHAPIHPNEVTFYKANIHAHIHHENSLEDFMVLDRYGKDKQGNILGSINTRGKYLNVDAHLVKYGPVTLAQLNGTR